MRIQGNEIFVHRGEAITLQFKLTNNDGTPYIVSSELENPCWLLAISTSKYSENNRYLYKAWLPINLPRFKFIKPVDITSLNLVIDDIGHIGDPIEDFDDITELHTIGTANNIFAASVADNGDITYYQVDDIICKKDDEYKYIDENLLWHDYGITTIRKTIGSDVTKDWLEQGYYYSMRLVDGEQMIDYLRAVYRVVFDEDAPAQYDKYTLYNKILESGYNFYDEFDVENALGNLSIEYVIIPPTRLTVNSNILGGL